MKILSKIALIFILGGIVLLNSTCNKKAFSKFPYNGYVYDSLGGAPVSGAEVSLFACNRQIWSGADDCDRFSYGTVKTDQKGYFTFGFIKEAVSNRYGLYVHGMPPYILQSWGGTSEATWFTKLRKSDLQSKQYQALYLK